MHQVSATTNLIDDDFEINFGDGVKVMIHLTSLRNIRIQLKLLHYNLAGVWFKNDDQQ